MRVHPDGTLTNREVYGPSCLGPAGFPDGIAFDAYGNLWGTLVFSEKIFALTPEGELRIIFDDGDLDAMAEMDKHFLSGTVEPAHMSKK